MTGAITAIAIGTGSTGVNSKSGGEVTIIGNIAASQIGIAVSGAGNAGTVTVTGNVSITGTATGSGVVDREGIGAGGNGTVLVIGNVSAAGENCTGVYANGSTVTVTGNVTSENTGVVSTGNASLPGSVTIDGTLTAGTTYIKVGTTPKTAAEDNKASDQPDYLQYTDGTHSVYIKDPSGVILVKNAAELKDALTNVAGGGTIKLLNAIDYNQGIVIDGKSFCLDLGSYTLNVVNSTGIGIHIKNAVLTVSGDGKLNATGTKGVQAHNSKISVYSATGTAEAGVEASCSSYAGGAPCEVTVTTHAQGITAGVYAVNDNCKITAASAKATGSNGKAVHAEVGGTAEISGNVDAPNGYGVYCVNGGATIGGHVTGKDTAVYLWEKGSIVISGNVNADNGNGTAVEIDGNGTPSNGTVTIEGTVSASNASYVHFVNGDCAKNQGVLDGAYLKYTDSIDGEKAGIVRIKKVNAVCKIGTQEFTSLSDGLPVAAGMATALKAKKSSSRVYVGMGDGELGEGSIWEAAMLAAHYKLGNLIAFIDRNGLSFDGETEDLMALEPIADKWRAFGWRVVEIDGHDMEQIVDALDHLPPPDTDTPTVIIGKTVKGNGISFMAGNPAWHAGMISDEKLEQAKAELQDAYNRKWGEQ